MKRQWLVYDKGTAYVGMQLWPHLYIGWQYNHPITKLWRRVKWFKGTRLFIWLGPVYMEVG